MVDLEIVLNKKTVFQLAVFVVISTLFFTYQLPKIRTIGNYNDTQPENQSQKQNRPTLFCLILTTSATVATRGKTVYETWGRKCDTTKLVLKFPESLTKENNSILKMVDFNYNPNRSFIDFNNLLEPADLKQEPNNSYLITEKVQRAFMHVYSKYSEFDWYLKADDDTFIFVDNLRKFLSDKDSRYPISYGYNYLKFIDEGYHSGGAGYVMSNEALVRLGRQLHANRTFCPSNGIEDVEINTCLRLLGVHVGDSIDRLGRERFHPLDLDYHYNGGFPDWLQSYAKHKPKNVIFVIKNSK